MYRHTTRALLGEKSTEKPQEPPRQVIRDTIRTFRRRNPGEIYPTATDSFGASTNHTTAVVGHHSQRAGGDTSRSKKALSRLTRHPCCLLHRGGGAKSVGVHTCGSPAVQSDAAAADFLALSLPLEQNKNSSGAIVTRRHDAWTSCPKPLSCYVSSLSLLKYTCTRGWCSVVCCIRRSWPRAFLADFPGT